MASACRPATEPTVPITAAPAVISAPGCSSAGPAASTGTTRLRTCARCCMRLTTSWPTKQPLVKDTPLQLIHVGLVREGIAERIVLAALRHAERDAVRVVVLGCGIHAVAWPRRYRPQTWPRPECAGRAPAAADRGSDTVPVVSPGALRSRRPTAPARDSPRWHPRSSTLARSLYMPSRLASSAAWSRAGLEQISRRRPSRRRTRTGSCPAASAGRRGWPAAPPAGPCRW